MLFWLTGFRPHSSPGPSGHPPPGEGLWVHCFFRDNDVYCSAVGFQDGPAADVDDALVAAAGLAQDALVAHTGLLHDPA